MLSKSYAKHVRVEPRASHPDMMLPVFAAERGRL